jgi:hypothetical protein
MILPYEKSFFLVRQTGSELEFINLAGKSDERFIYPLDPRLQADDSRFGWLGYRARKLLSRLTGRVDQLSDIALKRHAEAILSQNLPPVKG